jgi:hypothetical protein
MEQIQCDARGSARVFKAALDDAMKAAEFTKREISKRSVRKSISKKKKSTSTGSSKKEYS